MFKELRFDVVGAVKRSEKYDGEYEAIHQFNASAHKNMVLDYTTAKDARNAVAWLTKVSKEEKIPVNVSLYRRTSVVVTRK